MMGFWRLAAAGILLGSVATLLTGCVSTPAYISCKGKGVVSQTVNAMGYAGQGILTLDCGDGLVYEQRKYAPRERPAP